MPDRFHIVGGVPLIGDVQLSGSKNGALPILAATLLVEGEVVLENVPAISDIATLCELMRHLGAVVEQTGTTIRVDASRLTSHQPDRALCAKMRGSWYVAGPLIARLGRAEVPQPGGCAIGSRPVEYVTSQFGRLGVRTEERTDVMVLSADDGMRGATCVLDPTFRSPGATFNVAMAAVMARGRTVIEHASADPEVESFCRFLQACGAEIDGVGTERLVIEGRPRLHGCTHRIISDRIEAGTYLIAGAATRGAVRVAPVAPWHLGSLLDIMEGMGLDVSREDDAIAVRWVGRPRGAVVFTEPFPGFPTDLQPPMVALMCLADGQSEMHERIYDGRLAYVHELRRMGAQVRLMDSRRALISGVEGLQGTEVEGADMRAGAALVLAALAAEGESRVGGRHYVLRGYQDLEEKLIRLGARICVEATP